MSTTNDSPEALLDEALGQIRMLFQEAQERKLPESHRACLATASSNAHPTVRTIYISAINNEGLIFFINRNSGKGQQLQSNPHAALCFFWAEIQEQVTVEGTTEWLLDTESNRLWQQRSRDSQLAAWASNQAGAADPKAQRMNKREQMQHAHPFDSIPRPSSWQAILLRPTRIDFWATGWQHLRSRNLYFKDEHGHWKLQQDNP